LARNKERSTGEREKKKISLSAAKSYKEKEKATCDTRYPGGKKNVTR